MRQLKSSEIQSLRIYIHKRQNGICPICKFKCSDVVLDHHHKKRIGGTGQIRGVICRTCNVFLAKSENNCVRYGISREALPSVLRAIADYLERKQLPFIHPSEKPKAARLTKLSYNRLKKKMESLTKACPPYPKSGKLTVPLQKLFDFYAIEPEFYK